MKRITMGAPYANPFAIWLQLAFKASEMMWASAQVISHRTHRMALAGPRPGARDRREFALMGREKVEAAGESAFAMASHLFAMNVQFGMLAFRQAMAAATAMTPLATGGMSGLLGLQAKLVTDGLSRSAGTASKLSTAGARLAHGGLKPIHSRATGNARRLAKR
jgi:hypothetical protein